MKEPNQSKLTRLMSKKLGIEVKRTTIKGILTQKNAIELAITAGAPPKCMSLKRPQSPKLDKAVLLWLKQARGQKLPVSGDLIKEKAIKLSELLKIPDFTASKGWLDRFKNDTTLFSNPFTVKQAV